MFSQALPGRLLRTNLLGIVAALLSAVVTVGLSSVPASAVQNFDNAAIADQALSHVGQWGGQCKQFINDMAAAGSGGLVHLGGGYYSDYQREGGIVVSSAVSAKGDIIQLNGPQVDNYYNGMHTAIVVSYLGSNTFDVVDSNFGTPVNNEVVHHHQWNPFATASQYGLAVNIWRLGRVSVPTVQTGPDDPKGNYENLRQVLGGVRLTGWALDPNAPDPIQVDVYEGPCCANPRGAFVANVPRPDVGAAFPGYGNNHGFDITMNLPTGLSGSKTYCVYAINVRAGSVSPQLGCRTVTFTWNPVGNYENVRRAPGGVHLTGWALDYDTADPIAAHVYEGACCANPRGAFTANAPRPDMGAAFPGHGDNHGFEINVGAFPTTPVSKSYCAYAINGGYGDASPQLGCRTLTVSPDAEGNFESVTPVPGGARVAGWTLDPDTAGVTQVHVYEGSCCSRPIGAFLAISPAQGTFVSRATGAD